MVKRKDKENELIVNIIMGWERKHEDVTINLIL